MVLTQEEVHMATSTLNVTNAGGGGGGGGCCGLVQVVTAHLKV